MALARGGTFYCFVVSNKVLTTKRQQQQQQTIKGWHVDLTAAIYLCNARRGKSTKYNIHASKELSTIARGTGGFHGVTRRLWPCFRVNIVVESGARKIFVCWIGCVKKISLSSRLGVGHRARSAIARSTNPLVCNRRNFIFFASCWLGVSSTHHQQLPFPLKVSPRGLPVQCNSCRKGERFYPQHLLGRQHSGWHTHHPAFRRINTAPRSLRTPQPQQTSFAVVGANAKNSLGRAKHEN